MPPKTLSDGRSLAFGALLTALVALGQLSTSFYTPSLPALTTALNTDIARANLTLSLFLIVFGIAQTIYGPLSDRFGRRPVVLVGLLIYVVASLACAFAGSIEMLIAARLVQALGASVGPVIGRAVVRDLYDGAAQVRVTAYIGLALGLSPAIAPIIGGYLQVWFGWQANFLALTVIGGVIGLGAFSMLSETRAVTPLTGGQRLRLISTYGRLFRSPAFVANTLATSLVLAGLMAYAVGGPFVFIDLMGLSPSQFGMLNLFTVPAYMAGSLGAAKTAALVGQDRLMRLGLAAALAGGALMSIFAHFEWMSVVSVVGPMMLFALGLGVVLPLGIAGAMEPHPEIAGAASSLLGVVQMIVSGVIAASLGMLSFADQSAMAGAIFLCGAAASLFYLIPIRVAARAR